MSRAKKLETGRLPGLIAACLMAAVLSGCNYFVLAGYLLGGPPSNEPDFDAMTGKSMTALGVTVAVVCYAPPELKWEHSKIDREVARYVTRKMTQKHIRTVSTEQIYLWMDKHPDWNRPEEIGEAFGATYVVYIDLEKYSLYEPNSPNLYRGRSEANVSVFEMGDDGEGERIFSKEILSQYPLQAPKSTEEVRYNTFRREYLTRLSEEIGRLFYEWYNGDDVYDAV